MRSMELKASDMVIYRSQFDERTGTLVRHVELGPGRSRWDTPWDNDEDFKKRFPNKHFGSLPFSPVPETVDVSITDRCNFGCTYCYQDSRPKRAHGPKELVETILAGFNTPPYQIAIGGGEPTSHPDFEYILRTARELGTVPNFTTSGDETTLTDSILKTANEVCGGVAMTFHAFKGYEWFEERYLRLRKKLKIQLNVHLIADKDVAENLNMLSANAEKLGRLKIVLLAYYPDVGRATLDSMITKRVYQKDLPEALDRAHSELFEVAFSEGLLPYFNSRPELKVSTRFASPSEGLYSCYFDPRGRISESSFKPPWEQGSTCFEKTSQVLWEDLRPPYGPGGNVCYECRHQKRCATPHDFHYLLCAFDPHNQVPLKNAGPLVPLGSVYDRLRKPKV